MHTNILCFTLSRALCPPPPPGNSVLHESKMPCRDIRQDTTMSHFLFSDMYMYVCSLLERNNSTIIYRIVPSKHPFPILLILWSACIQFMYRWHFPHIVASEFYRRLFGLIHCLPFPRMYIYHTLSHYCTQ